MKKQTYKPQLQVVEFKKKDYVGIMNPLHVASGIDFQSPITLLKGEGALTVCSLKKAILKVKNIDFESDCILILFDMEENWHACGIRLIQLIGDGFKEDFNFGFFENQNKNNQNRNITDYYGFTKYGFCKKSDLKYTILIQEEKYLKKGSSRDYKYYGSNYIYNNEDIKEFECKRFKDVKFDLCKYSIDGINYEYINRFEGFLDGKKYSGIDLWSFDIKPGEENQIIDKSGYLKIFKIADLKKRSEVLKKNKEKEKTNTYIMAKKDEYIQILEKQLQENLERTINYINTSNILAANDESIKAIKNLKILKCDIESFRKDCTSLNWYRSIEAFENEYNRLLKFDILEA